MGSEGYKERIIIYMKIEIWSDVACPWCYIGKRRFESALAQFRQRDQVEIVWRSYQLAPDAPRTSNESMDEMLSKKYGMSVQQAAKMNAHVSELAAKEGLEYHLETAQYNNTFDAHRLIHLAATHGLQDTMKERLLKAYFVDGLAVADSDTLVKLAAEVGIAADEARDMLSGDAYTDKVRADIRQARAYGINGVPFFAVDEKYGISGAQPVEVFSEVLEKAWSESHPLIMVSTDEQDAGTCNDESCAI